LVTLDALLGLTELDDAGLIDFGVMMTLLIGAKGARPSQLLLFGHVLDLPLVGGVLLLRVSYQHPSGRLSGVGEHLYFPVWQRDSGLWNFCRCVWFGSSLVR
jgi:hypothetical protein